MFIKFSQSKNEGMKFPNLEKKNEMFVKTVNHLKEIEKCLQIMRREKHDTQIVPSSHQGSRIGLVDTILLQHL